MTYNNSTYIFLHRILKGFADALVKLFIPLLIYKATQDLMYSLLFCVITYAVTGVLFAVLRKFMTKFPILVIILHVIPMIAIQFLINNINITTIIIIAIVHAIATAFYWGGVNLVFGFNDEKTDTSKFQSAEHIGKIFCIAFSAVVLGEIQNALLFVTIFAGIMYILSVIPLLINYKALSNGIKIDSNLKMKTILQDNKQFNLYHICYSVLHVFTTVFLPLYLYSKGLSFTATGFILVLQEVVFIAGSYVSKFFSKINKEKLLVILCSAMICVSIVLIWLIQNVIIIYILTLLISFCFQGIFVLLLQKFFVEQRQKGFLQNSLFYREVILNFSRASTCGIYMIGLIAPVMFGVGIAFSGGICFTSLKCLEQTKEDEQVK